MLTRHTCAAAYVYAMLERRCYAFVADACRARYAAICLFSFCVARLHTRDAARGAADADFHCCLRHICCRRHALFIVTLPILRCCRATFVALLPSRRDAAEYMPFAYMSAGFAAAPRFSRFAFAADDAAAATLILAAPYFAARLLMLC